MKAISIGKWIWSNPQYFDESSPVLEEVPFTHLQQMSNNKIWNHDLKYNLSPVELMNTSMWDFLLSYEITFRASLCVRF